MSTARRGPNLRLTRSVLGGLADPAFAGAVGTGIYQGMLGPQMREEKKEEEDFFAKIIEAGKTGDIQGQGGLLTSYGSKTGNAAMVMQGINMLADANKQQGLADIDAQMEIVANPLKSLEERTAALTKAETIASSSTVRMTPQSFDALAAGAKGRRENTLNEQAKQLASVNGVNAIPQYTELYGENQAWRIEREVAGQQQTKTTLGNQDLAAFVDSQRPKIAVLDSQIAQFKTVPTSEWDMDQLNAFFNERMQIEQAIVDQGGNGNPAQFIGGAAAFYDSQFAVESARQDVLVEQMEGVVAGQRDFLYGIAKNQRYATADQFVEEARNFVNKDTGELLYSNWTESDWDALEADIKSYQERAANQREYIMNGTLGPTDNEWLEKYPNYFSDDDEFQSAYKDYTNESSDNLTRLSAGNIVVEKIQAARKQQRTDSRSEKNVKAKAERFVEAFIGAGDPDDLRYDPSIVSGGGFGQGDDIYDVVRRLSLSVDTEQYNKLIAEVGRLIKDNPNAEMRPSVLEAFKTLYIRTPGQAGTDARQEQLDARIAENKEGIAKLKEEIKRTEGRDISDEEAAILIQEKLAQELAADAERMSAGIRSIRERSTARGEDPFYAPSVDDLTEAASTMTGLGALDEFAEENRARVSRIVRGEGVPVYDRARNN